MSPVQKLLTPEEAADLLAVSPKGIKNWLRQGKLRGRKVGRLWRIAEDDLRDFLEASQGGKDSADDRDWLDADLSGLGRFEPYDWGPAGPPSGRPVRYIPGEGLLIDDDVQAS